MKKLCLFVSLALIMSCKQEKKEPSIAETMKTYTIAQMMDNEAIGGGSFSPNNDKLLIHSNRTGIYNAYALSIEDGEIEPLTQSDSSSVFTTSYFPNDERILLSKDNNGDEIYQIYLRDTNGTITNLTPFEGARANFYGWSQDEKSFYFGSNKRNPQFTDVYKMSLEDFSYEVLYENNEGFDVNEISDDEQYLALVKPVNTNDVDLFLFSIADGEMTKINQNQSANSPEDFSKDGKYLYTTPPMMVVNSAT